VQDKIPVGTDYPSRRRTGFERYREHYGRRPGTPVGDRELDVANRGEKLVLERLEAAVDELFLGRKVVEHGRLGDVGFAGDLVDADPLEAALRTNPSPAELTCSQMLTTGYRYELRQGEKTLATGHLSRADPLQVGDTIEINGSTGIVREIEPLLGQSEQRLVVQLLPK
jgi:hypothetical protein